jgi:hypothetical protein
MYACGKQIFLHYILYLKTRTNISPFFVIQLTRTIAGGKEYRISKIRDLLIGNQWKKGFSLNYIHVFHEENINC